MNTSRLNIHGIRIGITGHHEVKSLLERDFSFFKNQDAGNEEVQISLELGPPDLSRVPDYQKAALHHPEFVRFDSPESVTVVYHSGASVILDRTGKKVHISAVREELLHEISYIVILSLVPDRLQKRGMVSMHAMGVSGSRGGIVLMLPSGGGKSTLCMEIIGHTGLKLLGDDIVYIDRKLKLLPFPLRIGIRPGSRGRYDIPDRMFYRLKRRRYGEKLLIDPEWFRGRISEQSEVQALIEGIRWNGSDTVIEKTGRLRILFRLAETVIIGAGLPHLADFINWRPSVSSLLKLAGGLFFRTARAVRLLFRTPCYIMYIGSDVAEAARKIERTFGGQCDEKE